MDYFKAFCVLVAVTLVFSLIFAVPMMALWNWLMPEICGIRTIDYVESVGIILLGWCIITPARLSISAS